MPFSPPNNLFMTCLCSPYNAIVLESCGQIFGMDNDSHRTKGALANKQTARYHICGESFQVIAHDCHGADRQRPAFAGENGNGVKPF
jgi:hypothetical protein